MTTDVGLWLLYKFDAFVQRTRDERGQTLAEYGLIMAVIAVAVVALALFAFKDAIAGSFTGAETCITNAQAGVNPCR